MQISRTKQSEVTHKDSTRHSVRKYWRFYWRFDDQFAGGDSCGRQCTSRERARDSRRDHSVNMLATPFDWLPSHNGKGEFKITGALHSNCSAACTVNHCSLRSAISEPKPADWSRWTRQSYAANGNAAGISCRIRTSKTLSIVADLRPLGGAQIIDFSRRRTSFFTRLLTRYFAK